MDKSPFFVLCNWVLNWLILAHTWVAKSCSRVFHTWAEVSQLTIYVRRASDMDARIHDMMSWSCCSRSWNLGLTRWWCSSLGDRNFEGRTVDSKRKYWSLWPLNVVSICFCHTKKFLLSNLDEKKKLEGDWWILQCSPWMLSMKFP